VTLLKFDVFFFLGFMIQFLAIAVGDGGAESALTIAYIPFIVMTLSVSTWFMRRENTTGMLVVLVSWSLHAITILTEMHSVFTWHRLPSLFSNLHACTSHPTPRIICLLERS
jgi:hypothetical protein